MVGKKYKWILAIIKRSLYRIIDIHSHMIFQEYLDGLSKMGIDPQKEDGFPVPAWSIEDHLEYMNELGIERTILSLSTPHIHNGNAKQAIELAKKINDKTSKIYKMYPDRFSFAACLPMPEIEESIIEIKRAYEELDAVGIKVASHSNGVYLGNERFDPVFEELNRRNAVVLIHPSRPLQVPENVFTEKPAPLFEYLGDSTRAVINMLVNGTLEKFPDIKVVVPHTGAFLPLLKNRLIGISEVLIPNGLMPDVDIEKAFGKLYFDNAGDVNNVALDALLKGVDPSHVMFGGDYPYTPKGQIMEKIRDFRKNAEIKEWCDDILYYNAKRLFEVQ